MNANETAETAAAATLKREADYREWLKAQPAPKKRNARRNTQGAASLREARRRVR